MKDSTTVMIQFMDGNSDRLVTCQSTKEAIDLANESVKDPNVKVVLVYCRDGMYTYNKPE